LSMATFLKCHGIGVMFPGDLEGDGWRALLKRDDFKQALRETHVLVASHHGRENGCCNETLPFLTNVFYVVISDKGYEHETQVTNDFYRRIAKGGHFRQETRYVLTSRKDGRILFDFAPGRWSAG
jgi:hypothetical protein